mmetsp:Transcript_10076/g.21268  ORF Transcript_10076/g.21268 Transcript_10076/m.21268 type:complete len:130 (+) Transcript_10076:485-874(+)
MDGEDSHGCRDDLRFVSMGERPLDVFQNSLQFNQSLLWIHTSVILYLSPKSNATNEVLLNGAIARNRKDDVGDISYATPYLADIQLEDNLGVCAWMASCELDSGHIHLRFSLPQIAKINVTSSWDATAR